MGQHHLADKEKRSRDIAPCFVIIDVHSVERGYQERYYSCCAKLRDNVRVTIGDFLFCGYVGVERNQRTRKHVREKREYLNRGHFFG